LPQVEGNTELRIDKNEKMTTLKKKIQILMIQLWGYSATPQKDTYYMIDRVEIASLMPPVEDNLKEEMTLSNPNN